MAGVHQQPEQSNYLAEGQICVNLQSFRQSQGGHLESQILPKSGLDCLRGSRCPTIHEYQRTKWKLLKSAKKDVKRMVLKPANAPLV